MKVGSKLQHLGAWQKNLKGIQQSFCCCRSKRSLAFRGRFGEMRASTPVGIRAWFKQTFWYDVRVWVRFGHINWHMIYVWGVPQVNRSIINRWVSWLGIVVHKQHGGRITSLWNIWFVRTFFRPMTPMLRTLLSYNIA